MGCLFLQRDAHIYCENRHPDAYNYWHRGAYFCVKLGIRDAYFWGCLFSLDTGLRKLCHNCLESIPMSSLAIVCDRCHLVVYCSKGCQEEALPVHRVECEGLVKVEQARGKCKYNTTAECTRDLYWPPSIALVVARALNRKVLEWKGYEEWEISFLARPEKLPPLKESGFKKLLQFMWPLVLRSITTEEMLYDTYCKIALNASQSSKLSGVSAMAVYTNFSLFNHCCVPNCAWKMENGVKIVYTLKDIEKGEELCISYISDIHRLLPGNFRREKLMSVFGFECRCSVCVDEKVSRSVSWFLEHQKKSFIAPWSHKTAEVAMQEGKNALMKLIQLRVDGDWAKVAEIAQVALKRSKGILRDKKFFDIFFHDIYWKLIGCLTDQWMLCKFLMSFSSQLRNMNYL